MKGSVFHVRGASLIEAAVILPLLSFFIFGGASLINALYTRSVIEFSLQEGMRMAQGDPRFQVDLFSLNPSVPADAAKINDFKAARSELIQRTLELIHSRTLSSVNLETTSIDGIAGGSGFSLTLLPPSFSARVGGEWKKDAINRHSCDPKSVSLNDPSQPEATRTICNQTGDFLALLARKPAEFHAYTNMKLPFLGSIKTDISTSALIIPSAGTVTMTTIPPTTTVPPSVVPPSGMVVGGYTLFFTREGAGNGGYGAAYASSNSWGRIRRVTSGMGKSMPACEDGLKTIYTVTQSLYSSGWRVTLGNRDFWSSGEPQIITNESATQYISPFQCITP